MTPSNICIILTASIDPLGCHYLTRTDPYVRENDYVESLLLWLEKTEYNIVFVENSGWDISKIKKLSDRYQNRVEILQFSGNDYPRYLGKGYGEFRILGYALNNSEFVRDSIILVKVTGRLYVQNVETLIDEYVYVDVLCQPAHRTEVFISNKKFILDFTKNYSNTDDSCGIYFEHLFKKCCKTHIVSTMKTNPKLIGYSATTGSKYG